jgi:AraC family transcriptional regulator
MRIDAGGLRLVVAEYAPGERMDAHWHDVTTLGMVLRGGVEEDVRGREHQATAGGFVVKPAGTVHANRFGPAGARMASIGLRPGFRPWEHGRVRALEGWRWVDGGPAPRALWRLLRTARGEPLLGEQLLADGFWEMMDALEDDGAAAGPPADAPPWLRRVRDRLHDEREAAPRVRALAEAAGVHPVYLARAFRRAYGVPVTEYARRLRVRAAADRVASTGVPLARVALDAGFADQAHLTRELRRETGLTPGALRRVAAIPATRMPEVAA